MSANLKLANFEITGKKLYRRVQNLQNDLGKRLLENEAQSKHELADKSGVNKSTRLNDELEVIFFSGRESPAVILQDNVISHVTKATK